MARVHLVTNQSLVPGLHAVSAGPAVFRVEATAGFGYAQGSDVPDCI